MLVFKKLFFGEVGTQCISVDQFYVGEMSGLNEFLHSLEVELSNPQIMGAEVYADGDELAFVLSRIQNLPHAGYSTTWRGEFARFIVGNLRV